MCEKRSENYDTSDFDQCPYCSDRLDNNVSIGDYDFSQHRVVDYTDCDGTVRAECDPREG